MNKIPIILLAAGGSTRMGQAKQLLPWGDKKLIEFQIEKLLGTGNPVVVVLGAEANRILPLLQKYEVKTVVNDKWMNGMGTSVACGTELVVKHFPFAEAVLFTLIDQPLITAEHLQKLIASFNEGNQQIIASQSDKGWLGVPALYDSCYFAELKELDGARGAKTVISKYLQKVVAVEAGNSLLDMDTPENYAMMLDAFLRKSI